MLNCVVNVEIIDWIQKWIIVLMLADEDKGLDVLQFSEFINMVSILI